MMDCASESCQVLDWQTHATYLLLDCIWGDIKDAGEVIYISFTGGKSQGIDANLKIVSNVLLVNLPEDGDLKQTTLLATHSSICLNL